MQKFLKPWALLASLLVAHVTFFQLISWFPLQVASFVVLVLVPGFLLLQLMRIPVRLATLPVAIGLSLAGLLAIGLLLNTLLPLLHIPTPLRTVFVAALIDIVCVVMSILLLRRDAENGQRKTTAALLFRERALLIIYALLPIIAAAGAIRLNNGAGNGLAMTCIGALLLLVIATVTVKVRNERLYPAALYFSGLAILLLFSLRSNGVSGWDIQSEFRVFMATAGQLQWLPSTSGDAYNATLSLTVLPTIFKELIHVSAETVLKFLYPLLAAIMGSIVFFIAHRFLKVRYAFLVGLFFIVQAQFMQQMPALARQQIAFIFFLLMLYLLFDRLIPRIPKKILFIIFSFSMIVSHYSTAYVAIIVFVIAYAVRMLLVRRFVKMPADHTFFPSATLLLVMAMGVVLWYGQIIQNTAGIQQAVGTTINNLVNVNNQEQKSSEAQQALLGAGQSNEVQVSTYDAKIIAPSLADAVVEKDNLVIAADSAQVEVKNSFVANMTSLYSETVKKILKVLLALGFVIYVIAAWYRRLRPIEATLLATTAGFLALMVLIVLLPSISLFYNFERLYQQGLPILGILIAIAFIRSMSFLKVRAAYQPIILAILIASYFAAYSGFTTQLVGGDPSMQLANKGNAYDRFYKHAGEDQAAVWLQKLPKGNDEKIASDAYGRVKLSAVFDPAAGSTGDNLILGASNKQALIFTTYTNTHSRLVLEKYQGVTISFIYPEQYIQEQKSRIYSNNHSHIYR